MKFSLNEMQNIKSGELPEMRSVIKKIKDRKRPLHKLKKYFTDRVNIIAELKLSSPSAGILSGNLTDGETVQNYIDGGASGISVLAEKKFFGGSYELLETVSSSCDRPVLCKDFVYFEEQVEAAYLCGADTVLLISKVLEIKQLEKLYAAVKSFGMEPLVEIHEKTEIDTISFLNPELVLVNMRNLETLEMKFSTGIETLKALPQSVSAISASGINSKKDIELIMNETGTANFLIGSSLMQSNNPAGLLRELKNVC
jgi:indole-3-glycerol phosphate synthase